jgi:hypothetical protein
MSVLGIITCSVLELEIAHLLSRYEHAKRITIIENGMSERLMNSLKNSNSKELVLIEDISKIRHQRKFEVLVEILDIALHNNKLTFRRTLRHKVDDMSNVVDVILLGYGLCGNALKNPEEMFKTASVPVFLPYDNNELVDDCIGIIIGGREIYYKEQCKNPGTFFMTSGWVNHWREMLKTQFGGIDLLLMKKLLADYNRSLLLITPVMTESDMRAKIEGFNKLFSLRSEVRKGSLKMLEDVFKRSLSHLLHVGV